MLNLRCFCFVEIYYKIALLAERPMQTSVHTAASATQFSQKVLIRLKSVLRI